jgi:hypothetical protein
LHKGANPVITLERQLYTTRQDWSKNQTGIILKKQQAGNDFVQPLRETRKSLKLGNARNFLKLGSTSPSLNQEPHLLVEAPS